MKQSNHWGCMYCAAYALTGDNRWLENQENVSTIGFMMDAAKLGYVVCNLYINPENGHSEIGRPIDLNFWRVTAASLQPEMAADSLVTIAPESNGGLLHMVAVRLLKTSVIISDSALPEPIELILEDFLDSKYAQAVTVALLMTFAEIEEYVVTGQQFHDQKHLERLEQSDLTF